MQIEVLEPRSVAVVGAGYVGLTTGACMAEIGHSVICADTIREKVERLQVGDIPIHEPGLSDIVTKNLASGHLSFVVGAAAAVADADVVFLCVPTPQGDDGRADLQYVYAAAKEISQLMKPGTVVVNKSTVPVGTADAVAAIIDRDDIEIVSNPEFLREGTAVSDFLNPERVVVGAQETQAAARVAGLYGTLGAPIHLTDTRSAEMSKYAANAFLATKLSFVNEVATLCESVGADVSDVMKVMGSDSRIGAQFLSPGPGWGGSCFPKDTRALLALANDNECDFEMLRSTIDSNESQFDRVVGRITGLLGGSLVGKKIAVLGLAFKAGTDDTRDSPAIAVIRRLIADGATVVGYDPVAQDVVLEGLSKAVEPYSAADGADILVILTEWAEFGKLDFGKISELMNQALIFDARNLLAGEDLKELGFEYASLGVTENVAVS